MFDGVFAHRGLSYHSRFNIIVSVFTGDNPVINLWLAGGYMGQRTSKNIVGIIGFSMVIVLSFFIISDVEKTHSIWHNPGLTQVVYEDTPTPYMHAVLPAPRPSAVIGHLPRIMMLEATEYFAYKGYPITAVVELGRHSLNFHVAEGISLGCAQLAIDSIMEIFDALYEAFPAQHFWDFYLVTDDGSIPSRRINYNFAKAPDSGVITYMYFVGRYPIPMWLSMGLENYMMGGEIAPLSNECLAAWLAHDAEGIPVGDAWLLPAIGPGGAYEGDFLNAAYTIVRRWSHTGELYDRVRLAQADNRVFLADFNAYVTEFTGNPALSDVHVLYRFGDFEVVTEHGSYIFVNGGYIWTWPRVLSFIEYMDAAINYVSTRFDISHTDNIRVTLYPFGVSNIPSVIKEMAEMFGWNALEVNFVANDKITLAGTARFGTWAMSHEVTHLLLFREFANYHPATWMVEGMAVLGELLFRESFEGTKTYRFNAPLLSNIDDKSRNGTGHTLPFLYGEETFGRETWTYDDAGSFVLYLYNNYGIDALMAMYRSDNNSQFDMALEIFGKELEELIYSWREFLWPNGEPAGWWSR